MISLKQQQIDAAQDFVKATVTVLATEQGVHPETAVAGAARMAGTFLFRSFQLPLEGVQPGQAVLSTQANEQGPELIQILVAVLNHLGVYLNQQALGNPPSPAHQPRLGFLQSHQILEPLYRQIAERHGLSDQEAAPAAAVATGFLIHQSTQVLNPQAAFAIAAYGFVEGSKTAPGPVKP